MGFITYLLSRFRNDDLAAVGRDSLTEPRQPRDPLSALKDVSREDLIELFLHPDKNQKLTQFVPQLPDDRMQQNWTGSYGRQTLTEAFNFYETILEMAANHASALNSDSVVLDFGCGWGRIIRFFLKEVKHSNLFGTDCYEEAFNVARSQNSWCNFDLNDTMPPLRYAAGTFDIVYLYSVFSHLSEDMHLKWIQDFHRVIKPGGLIVATTRSRDFILQCQRFKNTEVQEFQLGLTRAFPDADRYLALYDNGEFCHSPTGGGGPLDPSFFGETCISEMYVKNKWAQWFELVEFRLASDKCNQNIICCRKKGD